MTPGKLAEMFDPGNEKMLITVGCGIFPPSDLYQVQGQGWVIWLIKASLLQSGNDRALWSSSPGFCLPLIVQECLFRLVRGSEPYRGILTVAGSAGTGGLAFVGFVRYGLGA